MLSNKSEQNQKRSVLFLCASFEVGAKIVVHQSHTLVSFRRGRSFPSLRRKGPRCPFGNAGEIEWPSARNISLCKDHRDMLLLVWLLQCQNIWPEIPEISGSSPSLEAKLSQRSLTFSDVIMKRRCSTVKIALY